MKRANIIATACFTAITGAGMLITAGAQDFTGLEKSILTFSAPIEMPGMTLEAGTYVFKRPDPNTARVIQVFSQDEKNILGQFLTVPSKRPEATTENVVTFRESKEGATPAVHFWYYPGRETGHEFVYPREQAMRIAARTGERVLSTESTDLNADAKISPIEGSAAATTEQKASSEPAVATEQAAATTASPATPDSQVADSSQAQQDAPMPRETRETSTAMPRETVGTSGQSDTNASPTDRPAELPQTASPLPLVGLFGLLSLGGFAALRLRRTM